MNDNITIIKGNLFDTKANVILHQVNCQGVMGKRHCGRNKKPLPKGL